MLNVWVGLMTTALPIPFAACSRLIRCRSTSTCFSTAESSFSCSEKESCICSRPSTTGLISSRIRIRSAFFAQPGKGSLERLRARRTLLLMTIGWSPPCGDNHSPGVVRIEAIFIDLHLRFQVPDLVPNRCRRLVILFGNGLFQAPLKLVQAVRTHHISKKAHRDFACVLCSFVHRFDQ